VRKGGAKAANPATNSPASVSTELPRCGVSPQPHRSGSAAPADHGVPELRGRLGGVDTGGSCVRIVGRPAGIAGGCEVDPVAHVTGRARPGWLRWGRPSHPSVHDGSRPRSGHSHATASAMVASMGLVASPSRGVIAWRRSMPGGAGVIVISRKRTGLQSHHSSIGCAIALGQSGLACVVLDLTLCSTGSSTQ
jgi:hypothetical protein